jgi:Zn-finger nucleic acid-binding protein
VAEAKTLHCGECGGPNAAGVRRCEFCRAAIATLRCGDCYQLNVPQNDFCSGCGHVLGLQPIELPSELDCPECGTRFRSLDGDPGALHDCENCGGQFVEHRLLNALIERRRRYRIDAARRAVPPTGPVRYFPCPACAQIMNRRNFGKASGVIVDVCARHGVWFECGELPKVLAFVEGGGIATARRRELGLPRPRTEEEERRIANAIAQALRSNEDREAKANSKAPATASSVANEMFEASIAALETIGSWIIDGR